jgi:hypothetical protein
MAAKTVSFSDPVVTKLNEVTPQSIGGRANGYSITRHRLQGGSSDGVEVVKVDNGLLKFEIVPTRGMGIRKAWLGSEEIGWRSPVRGPVHPQFVDLGEPSGLGWLDGFDELLVRCGLESNGAPEFDEKTGRLKYPLHGRIANKPAYDVAVSVDGDSGEISVTGIVEESRFHFLKLRMKSTIITKVGESSLRVRDEIENFSALEAETQMLYHVNFGDPLLDAGSKLVAPIKTVVPRNARAAAGIAGWDSYPAPQAGYEEQVYFLELLADAAGSTRSLLRNAHGTRGVSLIYNKAQLPWFTLWKDTAANADGYVTGLEPGTNFPNPRSYEGKQGRVARIPGGGKIQYELRIDFHGSAPQVEAAEKAIAAIQGSTKPKIFDAPQDGWCAP